MLRFELTFDAHRSLAQYRGRTGRMPDDLDHEVIDSPQALFRHLYEAHGLVEALDLDPATAPLQFWLRKHAELERSTARAVVQDRMATVPDRPPASGRHLLPRRSTAEGGSVGLSLGTPTAALATPPPAGGGARSRGPANPGATTGQGSGPRFRPFADPLVEAVAAALVARGLDERQVRRGLSSFTGADGRHGEVAVRAAFVAPMLEALAAELAGDPRGRARRPQPPPASPPRDAASPPAPAAPRRGTAPSAPAAARAEAPAPEPETWVAQPLAARGVGPEPDVDYTATVGAEPATTARTRSLGDHVQRRPGRVVEHEGVVSPARNTRSRGGNDGVAGWKRRSSILDGSGSGATSRRYRSAMQIDSGNTAWVLASSALVLFMTPGLAFFYGGMVRTKNVLGMLMQNYVVMGIVSLLWVLFTYSLAFGVDWGGHGFIGTLHFAGLAHPTQAVPGYEGPLAQSIPPLVFVSFQLMFAIITPALITGSTADRLKFGGFVAAITLWAIFVYAPVAHWVFSPTGWLFKLGAEDFAGGTVVHLNAGIAGVALALVVGRRRHWPKEPMPPHSLPLTLLGGIATEKLRNGKSTTLGAASGAVAGLVAITPACGYVNAMGAIAIGLIAGCVCALATSLKFRLKLDDSLDVGAVHLVGGATGALLIGFFGTSTVGGADG